MDAPEKMARQASDVAGLTPAVETIHPGELGVLAPGPRSSGVSSTLCGIGVDAKTGFLVQAVDCARHQSPDATALADESATR